MTNNLKICKECLHCNTFNYSCKYPEFVKINIVTGEKEFPLCSAMRFTHCMESGRFWKEKNATK